MSSPIPGDVWAVPDDEWSALYKDPDAEVFVVTTQEAHELKVMEWTPSGDDVPKLVVRVGRTGKGSRVALTIDDVEELAEALDDWIADQEEQAR